MPAKPPFVIHVNEMDQHPDAVYIGRAVPRRKLKRSKWANPYKVDEHGRTMAIAKFALGLTTSHPFNVGYDISDLTGKPLACWCRYSKEERTEDNACHGDVLVDLWKEHCDA